MKFKTNNKQTTSKGGELDKHSEREGGINTNIPAYGGWSGVFLVEVVVFLVVVDIVNYLSVRVDDVYKE